MAKCSICGTEYHSSSGTCFACGEKRDRREAARGKVPTGYLRLVPGVALLAIGVGVTFYGGNGYESGIATDYRIDWRSVAAFGVFLASTGIGAMVYPMLIGDAPAWRLREGGFSRNGLAVVTASLGAATLSFATGYLILATVLDTSAGAAWAYALAVAASMVMVTFGYAARPKILFGLDGFEEAPRRNQLMAAACLSAVGTVLEAAAIIYAFTGEEPVNAAIIGWLLVTGAILDLAAAGSIFPQGRAWVTGGVLK